MVKVRTATVNISFRKDLLELIDRVAAEESRSRSELVREATRAYIASKNRMTAIFELGERRAAELGLTDADVAAEIDSYRYLKPPPAISEDH
jgi:predicted transcriptional regulator